MNMLVLKKITGLMVTLLFVQYAFAQSGKLVSIDVTNIPFTDFVQRVEKYLPAIFILIRPKQIAFMLP